MDKRGIAILHKLFNKIYMILAYILSNGLNQPSYHCQRRKMQKNAKIIDLWTLWVTLWNYFSKSYIKEYIGIYRNYQWFTVWIQTEYEHKRGYSNNTSPGAEVLWSEEGCMLMLCWLWKGLRQSAAPWAHEYSQRNGYRPKGHPMHKKFILKSNSPD